MSLTRRLQILLDDERHERLLRASRERRQSVGALVREAIDRALPPGDEERRRAARAILEAPRMPVPDDPLELKREIAEARSRGL
ncbi:MAG: antitoxin [Gaiellaceae bacterium]